MYNDELKPIVDNGEDNVKNEEQSNSFLPILNKSKEDSKEQYGEKIINELPSWSIEPPVEIKRGME